jgi:Mrp family chromosome partitioning ATPase
MSRHYDYILVDTPPVGIVTDACVLAPHLDGVLLLVRQGHAKKEEVRQSVRKLQMAGARILGYVFNAVPTEMDSSYSYYYYGDKTGEKSEKNEKKS